MRVRRDALESELNDAMVKLSHTDFLFANFDLRTLFLDSLGKYYGEDAVLWFQDELTQGKIPSFQRVVEEVEFISTFFEMGMATITPVAARRLVKPSTTSPPIIC